MEESLMILNIWDGWGLDGNIDERWCNFCGLILEDFPTVDLIFFLAFQPSYNFDHSLPAILNPSSPSTKTHQPSPPLPPSPPIAAWKLFLA